MTDVSQQEKQETAHKINSSNGTLQEAMIEQKI
jgi:hypothetical protein